MRRALAMLAIAVVTALAPVAAMAQSTTSDDTSAVGPMQVNGADLAPADLQAPIYLRGNGQGDGNGQ